MEQCGGTLKQYGGTEEQCGMVWWNRVEQYGGTVEQWKSVEECGGTEQQWNSVVEQCERSGTVWWNIGTVLWNSGTVW